MGFISAVVPILNKVSTVFKEGMKVARAIANVCTLGMLTTALLISQITGADIEEQEDEQPP